MIRPIPNFPGYFADIEGNIWTGLKPGGRNHKCINTNTPIRVLKYYKNKSGYFKVSLHKDKKIYYKSIHRLILETFVGPCPFGMESCHNDGNPSNNKLSNLRWDTPSNNMKDKIKHGTLVIPDNRGEKHGKSKLTDLDVIEIKKLLKEKQLKQHEIARIFGVSKERITTINTGKSWSHI